MGNKKKVGTRYKSYKIRKSTTLSRPNNQPIITPSPKPTKSSNSKTKLEGNFPYYEQKDESLQYDIIDVACVDNLLGKIAVCKFCHSSLKLSRKSVVGLVTELKVTCTNCAAENSAVNCSQIENNIENGSMISIYDLNVRLVYGMRIIGKGYTAAKTLCGVMNLPNPPTAYSCHENVLAKACESVCVHSMKVAVEEAVHENDNPQERDLCVAVDGSWQKRGHVSLNGIVSVTSVDTGKVLDIYAMSKFCLCPEKVNNIHLDTCKANYMGTSGGMEVDGAKTIFQRSVPRYNVRYTEYLGDGDSGAFKSVFDSKPYGENVNITKLECVGHVQKRMGTRLRTLKQKSKKEKLSDGKPLCGKNRLTNAAIQKLQTFYGLAIRRNTHSLADMTKSVWATYFHVQSTNQNPTHQLCPTDETTWCKYNKSALDNTTYDHNKHFHLPEVVMLKIKPTFRSLADPQLLGKCLKGKSQNPNESLNNVIWTRIPKRSFVTLSTLKFGTFESVLSFNEGYSSKCRVLENLGLKVGQNMLLAMKRLDFDRVRRAEKATTDLEKKIRQNRTLTKRRLEDLYQESEDPDNPSYGAGLH